jgi:hypothetical protein
MSEDFASMFEKALQEVGLPESKSLIGRQVICDCFSGCLRTTIQSVSNVNDDGYVELGVAPVNFRGDLVTEVVFIGIDNHKVRTKYWDGKSWVKDLHRCNTHLL